MRGRSVLGIGFGLLVDAVVVGFWTLLVTLWALSAGWGRLQYYLLLGVGVVCYLVVTAAWPAPRE